MQYDIASLLFDAKADLPLELRQQLLDHYLDALADSSSWTATAFLHHYYAYVYVRMMQALGAYGFRGFYERKAHFLQSVPYALKNLRWLLHNVELPVELPALMAALAAMTGGCGSNPCAGHSDRHGTTDGSPVANAGGGGTDGGGIEFFLSSRAGGG